MLQPITTIKLRAPTVTVRPIKRTIFKKRKIRVESFDALSRTLGPIVKLILGIYEQYTDIPSADHKVIQEMVLAGIWLTKSKIQQKADACDYVLSMIVDKIGVFYRERGCPDKPNQIALQLRAARIAQS